MIQIKFTDQQIYNLANKGFQAETQFTDVQLFIDYAPAVVRSLAKRKYLDDATNKELSSQFTFSGTPVFMLVAKFTNENANKNAKDMIYSIERKYNHAVTGFDSNQLHLKESDIVKVVNAQGVTFALIPIKGQE